jgi:hypothetical protein
VGLVWFLKTRWAFAATIARCPLVRNRRVRLTKRAYPARSSPSYVLCSLWWTLPPKERERGFSFRPVLMPIFDPAAIDKTCRLSWSNVDGGNVSDGSPYEDAAQSLADFIRTFAAIHGAPDKGHLSDYEYGMLQLVAEKLEIDDKVREREAARVSSADERLSAARATWGLIRDED